MASLCQIISLREGATFSNIKIQTMGKELFGDFGRSQSTACQAALKGCQWQSLGEPLNYFKLLFSPIGLWSLQDGRRLIIEHSNLRLNTPLSTEPF